MNQLVELQQGFGFPGIDRMVPSVLMSKKMIGKTENTFLDRPGCSIVFFRWIRVEYGDDKIIIGVFLIIKYGPSGACSNDFTKVVITVDGMFQRIKSVLIVDDAGVY